MAILDLETKKITSAQNPSEDRQLGFIHLLILILLNWFFYLFSLFYIFDIFTEPLLLG